MSLEVQNRSLLVEDIAVQYSSWCSSATCRYSVQSTVQYRCSSATCWYSVQSTVQCSTVQYSTEAGAAVQYSTCAAVLPAGVRRVPALPLHSHYSRRPSRKLPGIREGFKQTNKKYQIED